MQWLITINCFIIKIFNSYMLTSSKMLYDGLFRSSNSSIFKKYTSLYIESINQYNRFKYQFFVTRIKFKFMFHNDVMLLSNDQTYF